jgi:hypothetical protein
MPLIWPPKHAILFDKLYIHVAAYTLASTRTTQHIAAKVPTYPQGTGFTKTTKRIYPEKKENPSRTA